MPRINSPPQMSMMFKAREPNRRRTKSARKNPPPRRGGAGKYWTGSTRGGTGWTVGTSSGKSGMGASRWYASLRGNVRAPSRFCEATRTLLYLRLQVLQDFAERDQPLAAAFVDPQGLEQPAAQLRLDLFD